MEQWEQQVNGSTKCKPQKQWEQQVGKNEVAVTFTVAAASGQEYQLEVTEAVWVAGG